MLLAICFPCFTKEKAIPPYFWTFWYDISLKPAVGYLWQIKMMKNVAKQVFITSNLCDEDDGVVVFSVVIFNTAQIYSTKSELKFCAGSIPAHGVSKICDGENLWQWPRLGKRWKRLLSVKYSSKVIKITIIAIINLSTVFFCHELYLNQVSWLYEEVKISQGVTSPPSGYYGSKKFLQSNA